MRDYTLHYGGIGIDHVERAVEVLPACIDVFCDGDSFSSWGERLLDEYDFCHGQVVFSAENHSDAWEAGIAIFRLLCENSVASMFPLCVKKNGLPFAITDASDWDLEIKRKRRNFFKRGRRT